MQAKKKIIYQNNIFFINVLNILKSTNQTISQPSSRFVLFLLFLKFKYDF